LTTTDVPAAVDVTLAVFIVQVDAFAVVDDQCGLPAARPLVLAVDGGKAFFFYAMTSRVFVIDM
jgi:hypothetical protein